MKRLAFLALFISDAALSQTAPDAGRLLQEVVPAPRLPAPRAPDTTVEETQSAARVDGPRVAVKAFRVSGITVFSETELLALVADAVGKELSLAELDDRALRITRHYRDAGYLVARAWLPPQDVSAGTVEIAVLEGRIGRVEVDNAAGLAASALAPLDRLVPGAIIGGPAVEYSLLALTDLPGVEVRSTLRPGAAVGTSDFLVEVAPGPTFSGSVDFDSFGNRYTGAHRLGASLFWNNPAGLGDQASARAQVSDEGMTYGRVGYQLPVGPGGTRVGAAWSEMRYELAKDFAVLDAAGAATVASLYLQHPLLRRRAGNLFLSLQYDDKTLADRVGATKTRTDKSLDTWTLGLNGNLVDGLGGGGSSAAALSWTAGRLDMDATSAFIDRASARSAGGFDRWNLALSRLQRVGDGLGLFFSWTEQGAGKNLNSSEKFSLGGAQGVRAYPQGEASGDAGRLVSAELRWQAAPGWELQGFYDDGRVRLNRNPWAAGNNQRHLSGYGIGASYAGDGFSVRAFAAWKSGSEKPTSDIDRTPRVWAQAVKYF